MGKSKFNAYRLDSVEGSKVRRVIVSILIIILLLPLTIHADNITSQFPKTIDEAVKQANEELYEILGYDYYVQNKVNEKVWNKYKALVYGEEHGYKKGEEYRFWGYTPEEDDFTSYVFPHDAFAGGYLDDRNWIEYPWKEGLTSEGPFDNNAIYKYNIEYGLLIYYKDVYKEPFTKDWYKYVKVLQPPTEYVSGTGRMWHKDKSGKMWYISVPLASNALVNDQQSQYATAQDYSTLIVRTGTENQTDGKPVANVQNEAVVEYRVTNSDKNTGIAEVELEIKNAKNITVEGLLEAKISGEKIKCIL